MLLILWRFILSVRWLNCLSTAVLSKGLWILISREMLDWLICIRWNTKRVINNLSMHLIKRTFQLDLLTRSASEVSITSMCVCGIPSTYSISFLFFYSRCPFCLYALHNVLPTLNNSNWNMLVKTIPSQNIVHHFIYLWCLSCLF